MDRAAELEFALSLADDADAITLERFRARDLRVEAKPDLSPVSDADRRVEEELRERIARERPDYAVLGEEYGTDGTAAARLVLDPIDGTRNFVRGIPVWATLIALEHDGRAEVAVVSAPALGRRWWALRGGGAFADGERLAVSGVTRVEDAVVSCTSIRSFDALGLTESFLALARRAWAARGLGDFWQHMLVAEGAVDVALDPGLEQWDWAAPRLVVEEAGGRMSDFAGAKLAGKANTLSSNGLLHDEILRSLTGTR
ncbi:MAG: histidinol-phosphatase [Gaiellaceae bacterium]|nr:histidinol-phosphatase [Gaiellaceae bacterium]